MSEEVMTLWGYRLSGSPVMMACRTREQMRREAAAYAADGEFVYDRTRDGDWLMRAYVDPTAGPATYPVAQ